MRVGARPGLGSCHSDDQFHGVPAKRLVCPHAASEPPTSARVAAIARLRSIPELSAAEGGRLRKCPCRRQNLPDDALPSVIGCGRSWRLFRCRRISLLVSPGTIRARFVRSSMGAKKMREFHCEVVNETVRICLWRKPTIGLGSAQPLSVLCDQRDCQHVDDNRPPCPLTLAIFGDEIREREENARRRREGY